MTTKNSKAPTIKEILECARLELEKEGVLKKSRDFCAKFNEEHRSVILNLFPSSNKMKFRNWFKKKYGFGCDKNIRAIYKEELAKSKKRP